MHVDVADEGQSVGSGVSGERVLEGGEVCVLKLCEYLDVVPGALHRGSGRPSGTTADLPTRGIPHRKSKQRNLDVRGVCQFGTGHSGGSRRRHQPDGSKQHPNITSGAVRQPPLHQGGGQHGTTDGHEKHPGGTQKPEGQNAQPQEVRPLRSRRRRQKGQQKNGPQVEKEGQSHHPTWWSTT